MLEHIVFNLAGSFTRERLHGRLHYVVPTAILAEGVVDGSQGPLLYRGPDIARSTPSWNHKPLVVNHPMDENGDPVMACTQAVLNRQSHGVILDTHYDNKLRTYSWVDVDRTREIDARILSRIEASQPIEVSTGVFTRNVGKRGKFNGTPYIAVAKDLNPDHLAVLPDREGAYSVAAGGGMFALNEKQWAAWNRTFTAEQRKKLAKSGAAMKDGSFPIATEEDLKNAIRAVGRASNPAGAKRHIIKRAKALGLTKLLPDAWRKSVRNAVQNELSHNDINTQINELLAEKYGEPGKFWCGYVCEVYGGDSGGRAIFRGPYDQGGGDQYWQIEYTMTGDTVALKGDAIAVEKEFVPASGGATYTGNSSTQTEVTTVAFDKNGHITALIAANAGWTEADRPALAGLADAVLEKIKVPGAVPAPAANAGTVTAAAPLIPAQVIQPSPTAAPVGNGGPMTVDQYLANAPAEIRGVLTDMTLAANAERARLVTAITAYPRNTFPKEVLERTPVANLRAIAALIPPAAETGFAPLVGEGAPTVNFGPAAGVAPGNYMAPVANAATGYGEPLPGQPALDLPEYQFENPLTANRR